MITFNEFLRTTGAPATGLAGTLAWTAYVNAATGVDPGAHPAFIEYGASGKYSTNPPPTIAAIIDGGATTSPRYSPVYPSSRFVVFAFDKVSGDPKTGLTPTWQSIFNAVTRAVVSSPPTFTELLPGIYRINRMPSGATGTVDLGAACNPRYPSVELATDTGGPVLSAPTPNPNAGAITALQSLGFNLADTGAAVPADLVIQITASFPGGAVESIYGSTTGGWTPLYIGGSSVPAALPGNFVISRAGPWPANPTLTVFAQDSSGLSTQQSWSWTLAQPAAVASSTIAALVSDPVYGSDVDTFLDLGAGPDLDPMLTIRSDPRIVLFNNVLRTITMPQGALFYNKNIGTDVADFINAALSRRDIGTAQSILSAAILTYDQIETVSVKMEPDFAARTLAIHIQGAAAAGPFSFVFQVQNTSTGNFVTAMTFN